MTLLDKSALFEANEAYWNASGGTDKGIEAAIVAYLARMRLTRHHETVMAENVRMRTRAGEFVHSIHNVMQAAE